MSSPSVKASLDGWVDECARLTEPAQVVWCDGSESEYARLVEEMTRTGTLVRLDPAAYPGCYLHRSHPSDVARSDNLTFICTRSREDAGPTNNWMSPREAEERVRPLFQGSMKGRPLYVVPYLLGPRARPTARWGSSSPTAPMWPPASAS